jgi:hypothetical protein
MRLSLLIGAALLAASTFVHAQAPAGDAAKGVEAKKERRAKMQEMRAKVAKACEGQQGDAQRSCMRKEMCAQAKDPAQCEARAKAGAERRAKAHEACKDKPEGERRACMREQMGRKPRA